MKKYQLGLIAVGLLLVGGLLGYHLVPQTLGGVSYDKHFFTDVAASGNVTVGGKMAVTGAATFAGGANITGYVTSTVGALTVTSTLGVTGASTLHALSVTTFAPSGISTMATTSVSAFCVKESGGNWVKITFTGVTPSYATSTTCL